MVTSCEEPQRRVSLVGSMVALAVLLGSAGAVYGAEDDATLLDAYARAEAMLPWNVAKRVYGTQLVPNWIDGTDDFSARLDTPTGPRHVRVSAEGSIRDVFAVTDPPVAVPAPQEPVLDSPDGRWRLLVQDYDLVIEDRSRGERRTLTRDGSRERRYASTIPALDITLEEVAQGGQSRLHAVWSPDSRRIVLSRIDLRGLEWLDAVRSVADTKPGVEAAAGVPAHLRFYHPRSGDERLPSVDYLVYDVHARTLTPVYPAALPWDSEDSPVSEFRLHWLPDGKAFLLLVAERGDRSVRLRHVDATDGSSRVVVEERSNTWVRYGRELPLAQMLLPGGTGVLWWSRRDGWGHLYRYDLGSGALLNRVTHGAWNVLGVSQVDEARNEIFFLAGGTDPKVDPYYRRLYRAPLDGGAAVALTPENADHTIHFGPQGSVFVDTFSRVDLAPRSVLRSSRDGRILAELQQADLSRLHPGSAAAPPPEPFVTLGRDGRTPLYGMLLRPSNFDPRKRYPVVDFIYQGPQRIQTPKAFCVADCRTDTYELLSYGQSIAELGMLVVFIDGMGTPHRSRAFHEVVWRNWADCGLPDHIAAIRELAGRYPEIDLARVAILGDSAGGYCSTRALLDHPDFFKAAVSGSGCHALHLDEANWTERYAGPGSPEYFRSISNASRADRLQGKLLLIHGDLDSKVLLPGVLQFTAALIRANKPFELLIEPNATHENAGYTPYGIKRRWDFLVEHLLGVEPPAAYVVSRGLPP